MDIYDQIVKAIRDYLQIDDYQSMFLSGGCYWFAATVASLVPNAYLMLNRSKEHCAVMVDQRLYDITGRISKDGYVYASEKEVQYMKKHYVPRQNLTSLDMYIQARIQEYMNWKRHHWRDISNCSK